MFLICFKNFQKNMKRKERDDVEFNSMEDDEISLDETIDENPITNSKKKGKKFLKKLEVQKTLKIRYKITQRIL